MRKVFKHFKLFEGIGLTLILLSWGANWYSVRRWGDIESSYWRFIETFHRATDDASDDIGQKLQFAISRAVGAKEIDYSKPDGAYIASWYSAEVRKLWLASATNGFYKADNTLREVIKVSNEQALAVDINLSQLNTLREEARGSLAILIDPEKGAMARQVPSDKDITPFDAVKIDNKVRAFNAAMTQPINEIGQAIKASKNDSSKIYVIIFVFGTIFVVSAKIFEWVNTVFPVPISPTKETNDRPSENSGLGHQEQNKAEEVDSKINMKDLEKG
jgi:hypothetical protein